ncbi:hypothetical protein Tco_1158861 [Tanacetum coccineum]
MINGSRAVSHYGYLDLRCLCDGLDTLTIPQGQRPPLNINVGENVLCHLKWKVDTAVGGWHSTIVTYEREREVDETVGRWGYGCGHSSYDWRGTYNGRLVRDGMPTAELLAVAAKLTEAEAELRLAMHHQTGSGKADDDEEMAPKVEQSKGKKYKRKPIIFCIEGIGYGYLDMEDFEVFSKSYQERLNKAEVVGSIPVDLSLRL